MELTCAKCGSDKIMPLVGVQNPNDTATGQLRAFVGYANPEAWVFKEPVYAQMRARICGECGFTELFTDKPEAVYAAYLKTKPPHPAAIPGDWKVVLAASQNEKAPRRSVYEALRRHHVPHGPASSMADAFRGGTAGELQMREAHRARAIVEELRELGIEANVVEPPGLLKDDSGGEGSAHETPPADKQGLFEPTQQETDDEDPRQIP